MIKIDCPELSAHTLNVLRRRQEANATWSRYNPSGVKADREIRETLQDAFRGKCGYCEIIEAETIDHFWPQSRYADKIWNWTNYIWCCDACQRRKGATLPCNAQGYQMVNPREDEPLHFLQIDPETGAISERSLDSETIQRGQYTITVLKLNERPDLDHQRQHLYFDILDWISEMVKW
jgi:uncharacterized protein (TIGR02646 family)